MHSPHFNILERQPHLMPLAIPDIFTDAYRAVPVDHQRSDHQSIGESGMQTIKRSAQT